MKLSNLGRLAVPAALLIAASTPALADEGVKVGGYVDINALTYDVAHASSAESIDVAGGALYLSKELGRGRIEFDLPVSSVDEGLGIAGYRAQAFIEYKYGNGLSWKLGQFDGLFTLERNDTNSIPFARHGIAYEIQPIVHQALAIGYRFNKQLELTVYGGKNDGKGTNTGARLAWESKNFDFGVGGYADLSRGDAVPTYIDAILGMHLGHTRIEVGAETDSTGDAEAVAEYGITGFLLQELGERFSAGARVDFISGAEHEEGATRFEFTVGPQVAMTRELTAKLDYTYGSDSEEEEAEQIVALNAVYSF